MNDRQDPQDPYSVPEQQLIGYDAYGQPVYGQAPAAPAQQYDAYGYGYDAYGRPVSQPAQDQGYDPYAGQQQYGSQGYGYDTGTGQYPAVDATGSYPAVDATGSYPAVDATGSYPAVDSTGSYPAVDSTGSYPAVDATGQYRAVGTAPQWIPQQPSAPEPEADPDAPAGRAADDRGPGGGNPAGQVPGQRREAPDYRTEQFSFIEEPDEDSQDVIDWLKFTESRTERREEAKRRGRNRVTVLIVVLALFVVSGVGYLWYAGKLPFLGGAAGKEAVATGPQKRDMIVVHLHNTRKGGTSTALLVDNVTTKRGATVLLPNSTAVTGENGTGTTLGKSVDADGLGGTRDSLDTLLGTKIEGTWRLDTPYLENLVDQLGGIEVDTDAAVPADAKAKTPAVGKGEKQDLSGPMAVAYATYRAPGEPETKQLERFGTVLYGTLRKMPSDERSATVSIETLGQILDPSLTEKDLGSSLAKLGEHAKVGDYTTKVMPVKGDGTLTEAAVATVVKDVLGGALKAAAPNAAPRVALKDGTGGAKTVVDAQAALVNAGYTFIDGGKASGTVSATEVTYADDAAKPKAVEVAKTLGLKETAVKKAPGAGNAEVTVVLGTDYKTP
ncbi:LCP family protein [Streptomyces sp. NRRL S-87]|uniref:LCP family protein n=1 Tax=Streptomyces sp. NRRL S-87 TaxID=1463920 RepID=UPI0004BE603F|nr:LCP family protein [Streptomyces sp. NRRL S-87]